MNPEKPVAKAATKHEPTKAERDQAHREAVQRMLEYEQELGEWAEVEELDDLMEMDLL